MEIRAITDELSGTLAGAFKLADELGIKRVSLRQFETGRRFPDLRDEDLRPIEAFRARGGEITLVSPGFYKGLFPPDGDAPEVERDLREAARVAGILGARDISFFSFARPKGHQGPAEGSLPGDTPEALPAMIAGMAKAAREAGFREALLESCFWQWGDTGRATAELIRRSGDEALGLLWDPANAGAAYLDRARAAGVPVADLTAVLLAEWRSVRSMVREVHVRNIVAQPDGSWKWASAEQGLIDWQRLVGALLGAGYRGPVTVEHHQFQEAEAATRRTVQHLRSHCGLA